MNRAAIVLLSVFLQGCSTMFFQPSKALWYNPREANLNPTEITLFSKDGTKLMGWEFEPLTKETRGWVIQFHGNAGNISSHYPLCVWLIKHGYGLTIIDYRGYGPSEGTPTQKGVEEDAISIIEDTASKHSNLVIVGQSLGGPIAIRALSKSIKENPALKGQIKTVVIDSSFVSYQKEAAFFLSRTPLTWLFQPLAFVLVSDEYAPYDSFENLKGIPILVIHGTEDNIVPEKFGREVFDHSPTPKSLWVLEGSTHIESMTTESFQERFVEYLESL